MINISKVLTLDKMKMFNALISGDDRVERVDYFCLGNPILDPPYLRGTIIIELNFNFILDNKSNFIYGSPIDVGSIKFGFIKVDGDLDDFVDHIKCDYFKFIDLISDIKCDPLSFEMIKSHQFSIDSSKIIESYFQPSVVDLIKESQDPHTWLFEFCLNKGYRLGVEHIEKVFIPNTYLSTLPFIKLKKMIPNKIVSYNPKYGIECYD